ncbi:hypothetical protein SBV1_1740004 [Verrucomicrobia bacterium]|nr:hypothetical protein SBV1_1740004 [Verrucomicrobiota bacterium]
MPGGLNITKRTKCLIYRPEIGAPAATRTRDPLLRRQMLYPTELRARTPLLSVVLR